MNRLTGILCLAAALTLIQQNPARTDGCLMPSNREWKRNRERSLINEPDQKAFIFYTHGKEQLIISPSYSGRTSEFAWVVPVPSIPKVEILKGAPFHELARLVEPAPPMMAGGMKSKSSKPARQHAVTVIERKTVGDYDVTVLSATDSLALVRWLNANQYHMPERAKAPIDAYIKEGWTFVASKIRVHDSAKGLSNGTLTPLRLTFDTPNPIYPMRLSSANPEPFSLLVYIAMPLEGRSIRTKPFILKAIKAPGDSDTSLRETTLRGGDEISFPTLNRLSRSGMHVYWMKTRMDPRSCDKDYIWTSTTKSDSFP